MNLSMMLRLAKARAVGIFVCIALCLLAGSPWLTAQPKSVSDGPGSLAGAYKLQWRQSFPFEVGVEPVGTASDDGSLWLVTDLAPGSPQSLTRVGADGRVASQFDLAFPWKGSDSVSYLSVAASGPSIRLLVSTVSGKQKQKIAGAFTVPVRANGVGEDKRFWRGAPQFSAMRGNGSGQFVVAGDEGPLTLVRLNADGAVLWIRSLAAELKRPAITVSPTGDIFLLSQGDNFLSLQEFDDAGKLLKSARISGKQGTFTADANGGCTVLFSREIGGPTSRVYLVSFDRLLQRGPEMETPLRAWVGQTYEVIWTPQGHLAIGEGGEQGQQIAVGFDGSGRVAWRKEMPRGLTANLLAFKGGFFVVTDTNEGRQTVVEKYGF